MNELLEARKILNVAQQSLANGYLVAILLNAKSHIDRLLDQEIKGVPYEREARKARTDKAM